MSAFFTEFLFSIDKLINKKLKMWAENGGMKITENGNCFGIVQDDKSS